MSKHTPGPWAIEALRYEGARIVAGPTYDKSSRPVGWVAADDTMEEASTGRIREVMSDEANANARLIAAAPELLEALRGLLRDGIALDLNESRRWHYNGDRRIENFRDSCPMCLGRAAIAKAEGKP